MDSRKRIKDLAYKNKIPIVGMVLMILLIVAGFVFELTREIVQASLNLIMIGFFLFVLFEMLRSKRHIGAVFSGLCIVLYLAMIFW